MEVERFKHRQLAPTVGLSSRSSGEFEGPLFKINLLGGEGRVTSQVRRATSKINLQFGELCIRAGFEAKSEFGSTHVEH
jgi:hypothetical protein